MVDFGLSELITGGIASLITAITGWFTIVKQARAAEKKAHADETTIALSAWKELINPLQEELREAKQEISALREALEIAEERHKNEREELVEEIKKLRAQMRTKQNI